MTEWNPLASVEDVTVPLKIAGTNDDGSPRATLTCRRWSGATRLVWDDAIATRMIGPDQDGDDVMLMGTLRLVAASLTLHGSTGFPAREDGTAMFTGTPAEIELDLLALDTRTYNAVTHATREVQPTPGSDDRDDEDDPKADSGEGDLPDPSTTSSTPPTPTDDVPDPQGSPGE